MPRPSLGLAAGGRNASTVFGASVCSANSGNRSTLFLDACQTLFNATNLVRGFVNFGLLDLARTLLSAKGERLAPSGCRRGWARRKFHHADRGALRSNGAADGHPIFHW